MKYIFFFIMLFTVSVNGQRIGGFPSYSVSRSASVKERVYHKGFVVKTAGDTIFSNILLGARQNKIEGVYLSSETSSEKRFLPLDEITFIRIFQSDKIIMKGDVTDFYTIGTKKKLYRLIRTGSKSEVFDNSLYVDENKGYLSEEVFVKTRDEFINTYSFWGSSTKRNLIKFLNKKMNSNFKPQNFKNAISVIEKIVEN
ncbi:hypothetical protein [Flavobacterium terrisoli]|uniref:hypothetical protein n=1 Tax=Flavobacterium terrisoli TaxID=3242195 RepID=UPI0025429C5A|nr:hypothetical protein [Flavobacterium buctense]